MSDVRTDDVGADDAIDPRPSVRRRLLDAAAAVIEEVGEENLTLARVVRRAGLTTGAVYSNFASREELVVGVYLDHYVDRMWEGIDALEALIDSDLRGPDFAVGLEAVIVRPDDPTLRVSRWLRVRAIAASARFDQMHDAVTDIQQRITARLVALVERAQANGDVDPSRDPRALALLIQQFGFALVLDDLAGEHRTDPDAWVELVRDLVLPLFVDRS